ncbi:bifunctional ornithine acetyltransferase/N-acetylglutamate synthase [Helicobacter sp. 11S02629-2]|uniref:bifunctional ornithine acetyltransferase/N-acetylglutamate synthase n=1 Tax=Helicobacter sp. 11S02629-2 TaxID=1476195 RepID=UPI000BA6DC4F|nr:bifunctional ornithine acetyltransferase/N-acetylglutamate synthase [Helicobacter sp. 11S02629-2]PAF46066.1 bifunctional ornithine acetyltransferase/N-acetylglutamate synthase [Helicobacter sp. 11S02629-2]
MEVLQGGISTPKGFKAGGKAVGIRKIRKDLALIVSDKFCTFSGVFTQNKIKAAPVLWSQKLLHNKIKGIVINSGNANACTGKEGYEDAKIMAATLAMNCNVESENILVASTGVIGVPLPIEKIVSGIKSMKDTLESSASADLDFAEAIMTTDTYSKTYCVATVVNGTRVTIGASAKGSGMIHPNMATTLCMITSDINIDKALQDEILKDVVDETFNMMSVDGDTSTNDCMFLISNGEAGNAILDSKGASYEKFKAALLAVCKHLAIECIRDGEGATKLMEVDIKGARSNKDARLIARSVTSSTLFKAALFGSDANWGRALCAIGYSGGEFNENTVDIAIRSVAGTLDLMVKSKPIVFDEEKAKNILLEKDIYIDVNLNDGDCEAKAWGCDLSYEYVKINGDYRS